MNIPSALLTWTGLRTPPLEEHPSEPQPLHLPTEIIEAMISFIPHHPTSQATLYSLCLVSWSWHSVAITRLYESPYLYGKNYDPFVRTICPSLNRHVKKSDLAGLVRCLDMSRLVHQGSRSTTARVLGRCKGGMVEFTAPQANFGINCLAALSKCINLRTLDLSLLSESISYKELSSTLRSLTQLSTLKFPRSATKDTDRSPPVSVTWPPHLSTLSLSGNM
ncbi:F-box protein, partial [Tothia fuscella]